MNKKGQSRKLCSKLVRNGQIISAGGWNASWNSQNTNQLLFWCIITKIKANKRLKHGFRLNHVSYLSRFAATMWLVTHGCMNSVESYNYFISYFLNLCHLWIFDITDVQYGIMRNFICTCLGKHQVFCIGSMCLDKHNSNHLLQNQSIDVHTPFVAKWRKNRHKINDWSVYRFKKCISNELLSLYIIISRE